MWSYQVPVKIANLLVFLSFMEFKQIYKSFTKRTSLFVFSIRKEDRGKEFIWTCVSCISGRSEGDGQSISRPNSNVQQGAYIHFPWTIRKHRRGNKIKEKFLDLNWSRNNEAKLYTYRILFTSISNFTNICSEVYVWSMQIKICTMATKHWEKGRIKIWLNKKQSSHSFTSLFYRTEL